jgi:PiT family inorganic phosphate transporter
VIAALLLATGHTQLAADGKTVALPEWVALSAYSAIALGTLWGGWKIIETMALKITTLHASSGVAANVGASTAIFGATAVGMPISTTHAAAASIVGAGVGSRRGARWNVVGRMVLAWILTMPSAAAVAFVAFRLTQLPTGYAWVCVGAMLLAFAAWAGWAMTHTIHADDVAAEVPSEEELDLRDTAGLRDPATDPSSDPASRATSA